jgi:hypothetical protein
MYTHIHIYLYKITSYTSPTPYEIGGTMIKALTGDSSPKKVIYTYMYVCTFVHIYIDEHICINIRIQIYIYAYEYIHIGIP